MIYLCVIFWALVFSSVVVFTPVIAVLSGGSLIIALFIGGILGGFSVLLGYLSEVLLMKVIDYLFPVDPVRMTKAEVTVRPSLDSYKNQQ